MSATPLFSATITATGPTGAFSLPDGADAQVFLQGGTATIQLEASIGDNTWSKVEAAGSNQIYAWSLVGDNQADSISSSANGLEFRFNCTAFTSAVTVSVYR